jgi:hypothetical protein
MQVNLAAASGRYDLIVGPADAGGGVLPLMPSLDEPLQFGVQHAALLGKGLVLSRAAIVVTLVKVVDSPSAVTSVIGSLLPSLSLPTSAQDINFQLNVRQNVPGGTINRLCRWSSSQFHFVGMQIGPGGPMPVVSAITNGVSFVIDVNTVPEMFVITSVDAILAELAAQTKILMSGGYDRLIAP